MFDGLITVKMENFARPRGKMSLVRTEPLARFGSVAEAERPTDTHDFTDQRIPIRANSEIRGQFFDSLFCVLQNAFSHLVSIGLAGIQRARTFGGVTVKSGIKLSAR